MCKFIVKRQSLLQHKIKAMVKKEQVWTGMTSQRLISPDFYMHILMFLGGNILEFLRGSHQFYVGKN